MDRNSRQGTAWRGRGSGRGRLGAPPASRSVEEDRKHNAPQTKAGPNRRPMNLIASVSRSSGLEKDGDDLKNYEVQEEYRKYIQERVDSVLKCHGKRFSETERERKSRLENQENVLILFRKLREGIASSGRNDDFALEVYETSLYLSVIFESPKQTASIIPHLFPPKLSSKSSSTSTPQPAIYSVLCTLLHHLVSFYPSQGQYHQHLRSIDHISLRKCSESSSWFSSVTRSLRMRNYARLACLTKKSAVLYAISQAQQKRCSSVDTDTIKQAPSISIADSKLALDAVLCLLDNLRQKAAETTWTIIRSAYREFSTNEGAEGTKLWLSRSLSLNSVYHGEQSISAVDWMEHKVSLGNVRKKEGCDGRWIVCKTR